MKKQINTETDIDTKFVQMLPNQTCHGDGNSTRTNFSGINSNKGKRENTEQMF